MMIEQQLYTRSNRIFPKSLRKTPGHDTIDFSGDFKKQELLKIEDDFGMPAFTVATKYSSKNFSAQKMLRTNDGNLIIGKSKECQDSSEDKRGQYYVHCFKIREGDAPYYHNVLRDVKELVPDEECFINDFDETIYGSGLTSLEKIQTNLSIESFHFEGKELDRKDFILFSKAIFEALNSGKKIFVILTCENKQLIENSKKILRQLYKLLPYNIRAMTGYYLFFTGEGFNRSIVLHFIPNDIYEKGILSDNCKGHIKDGFTFDFRNKNIFTDDWDEVLKKSDYLNFVSMHYDDPEKMTELLEFIEERLININLECLKSLHTYDLFTQLFLEYHKSGLNLNECECILMLFDLYVKDNKVIIKKDICNLLNYINSIIEGSIEKKILNDYLKLLLDCYNKSEIFREEIEKIIYKIIKKSSKEEFFNILEELEFNEGLHSKILKEYIGKNPSLRLRFAEKFFNEKYSELTEMLISVNNFKKKFPAELFNAEIMNQILPQLELLMDNVGNYLKEIITISNFVKDNQLHEKLTKDLYKTIYFELLNQIIIEEIDFKDLKDYYNVEDEWLEEDLDNDTEKFRNLRNIKALFFLDESNISFYSSEEEKKLKEDGLKLYQNFSSEKSKDLFSVLLRLCTYIRENDDINHVNIVSSFESRMELLPEFIEFYYQKYENGKMTFEENLKRYQQYDSFEEELIKFSKEQTNFRKIEKAVFLSLKKLVKEYPSLKTRMIVLKEKIKGDDRGDKEFWNEILVKIKILKHDE